MRFTQNVAETAEKTQEKQTVNEQEDDRFDGDPPIETLNELYGKVIFADGRSQYMEIKKELPSGNLTEEEIHWLHGLQDMVRMLGVFESQFGLPVGPSAHFVQRKMDFITMASKSRKGFAIKEISQNRVQSDERIATDEGDDSPGLFQRLKQNFSGTGLADGQVIGKPNYGTYTQTGRRRARDSW